jgi:hypothetical protein
MNTHGNAPRTTGRAPALGVLLFLLSACSGPSHPATDMRVWTRDFELRVSAETMPPLALEPTRYTITVRDRLTHEPIANGQGRIFATNADGKSIWDGFVYGPEVGAYHARLMFLTAGEWAMNVQFRRDSTKALQRPEDDWRQTVRPAAEPGEATKP